MWSIERYAVAMDEDDGHGAPPDDAGVRSAASDRVEGVPPRRPRRPADGAVGERRGRNPGATTTDDAPLWWRVTSALSPIIAGMALDAIDLATMGPLGLTFGLFLGAVVGWTLSPIFGLRGRGRWWASVIAGLYCAIPGTEFLPIATMLAALARFVQPPARTP